MYLIREVNEGFFVDYKLRGRLIESYFIRLTPRKECSCRFFAESRNCYNHFHINLVEYWVKQGKPKYAMYDKDNRGKIKVLCEGIKG